MRTLTQSAKSVPKITFFNKKHSHCLFVRRNRTTVRAFEVQQGLCLHALTSAGIGKVVHTEKTEKEASIKVC